MLIHTIYSLELYKQYLTQKIIIDFTTCKDIKWQNEKSDQTDKKQTNYTK